MIYFRLKYSGIFALLSLYITGILLTSKWPSRASRPLGLLLTLQTISFSKLAFSEISHLLLRYMYSVFFIESLNSSQRSVVWFDLDFYHVAHTALWGESPCNGNFPHSLRGNPRVIIRQSWLQWPSAPNDLLMTLNTKRSNSRYIIYMLQLHILPSPNFHSVLLYGWPFPRYWQFFFFPIDHNVKFQLKNLNWNFKIPRSKFSGLLQGTFRKSLVEKESKL